MRVRASGSLLAGVGLWLAAGTLRAVPEAGTPMSVDHFFVSGSPASSEVAFNLLLPDQRDARVEGQGRDPVIYSTFAAGAWVSGVKVTACTATRMSMSARTTYNADDAAEVNGQHSAEMVEFDMRFKQPRLATWLHVSLTPSKDDPAGFCVRHMEFLDAQGRVSPVSHPLLRSAQVTTSGALTPLDQYAGERAFDHLSTMAWATPWRPDGAFLEVAFTTPQPITSLRLLNGYHRSEEHLAANAAVREYEVWINGKNISHGTLAKPRFDTLNEITWPNAGDVSSLKLVVKSVHRGERFQDLVISEVYLLTGPQWVDVDISTFLDAQAQRLDALLKPAGLENLVGTFFWYEYERKLPFDTGNSLQMESTGEATLEGRGLDGNGTRLTGGFQILEVKGPCATFQVFGLATTRNGDEEKNAVRTVKLKACRKKTGTAIQSQTKDFVWRTPKENTAELVFQK